MFAALVATTIVWINMSNTIWNRWWLLVRHSLVVSNYDSRNWRLFDRIRFCMTRTGKIFFYRRRCAAESKVSKGKEKLLG
jgi:hypothetical protein